MPLMKPALPVVALFVAAFSAQGATAYKALEILGKQKGNAVINKVTEVRGDNGRPQPTVWRITVKDSQARGGLREYEVRGSKLTEAQAPEARPSGPAINMDQLNLDSDGAQTIAEQEAKKAAFAYDHASYSLRSGSIGGSPVWEIRLTDERTGDVATLTAAATTGKVLSTDGLTTRRKVAQTPAPAAAAPAPKPDHVAAGTKSSGSSFARSVGDELNYLGNRVGNHMARRGRQIGDFFYNLTHKDKRDTAGPHGSTPGRDPSPAPAPVKQPAGGGGDTDYVRPSRVRD